MCDTGLALSPPHMHVFKVQTRVKHVMHGEKTGLSCCWNWGQWTCVFAIIATEIKVRPTLKKYKVTREVHSGLGAGRVCVGWGGRCCTVLPGARRVGVDEAVSILNK